MPKFMDHNEFDFIEDLIEPFQKFLKNLLEENQHSSNHKKKEKDQEGSEENKKKDDNSILYFSKIDQSTTDYNFVSGEFDITFDQVLYEPPRSVVEFERKMNEE